MSETLVMRSKKEHLTHKGVQVEQRIVRAWEYHVGKGQMDLLIWALWPFDEWLRSGVPNPCIHCMFVHENEPSFQAALQTVTRQFEIYHKIE